MSIREYKPDRWVILKINTDKGVLYKVMGGWFGGYLGSDNWRINSGITKVEIEGDVYKFHGSSGSVYICNKNNYGLTVFMSAVLPDDDKLKVLDDSDFTLLEL